MRSIIVESFAFDHVPEFMVRTSKMLFKRQVDGHASDRRYQILEAALRLIGQGGPDAVTFRRVAAGAKAPLSSLTYYFASRQGLIREAFRLYLSEASAFVLGVEHEKRPRTPSGVVDLLLEIVRKEFSHDPAMVRVEYELILYAARDSSLAREFNDYERKLEAGLARLGNFHLHGADAKYIA